MITRRDALLFPVAAIGTAGLRLPLIADGIDPTRVFADSKKPTDLRLGPPRTLDSYAPFVPPKTKEEWAARRKQLREQLLVATGLWPQPEKTPLNAVVHGKVERDGYTIEKVFFASTPGHYVSGNLYRPAAPSAAKRPGVLFAHGHWANGRLHVATDAAAKAAVKAGGEPDLERARYFMQAIPITLARLGFVVFQYDMIGVGDSSAIPHAQGFADVDGELRLQSAMGLQTWNSVRSLDFLESLPDVDPKRLGMTGASGGGTQTFMLAAIDDRLAAAFPAVMVSTAMQGGCVCENCSLLRVNTGNVEIAGLFAPKPMAFSAANDWTKEFMTKGLPELKQLYKLIGDERDVTARAWLEYGHQYNIHARQFMYAFFSRVLLKKTDPVEEKAYKPTPPAELRVYDAGHPRPKDELPAPRLRAVMAQASDAQIAKLTPKDAESLKEFKRVVGTALRAEVNSEVSADVVVQGNRLPRTKLGGLTVEQAVIGRKGGSDTVPALSLAGEKVNERMAVVWLHPAGKASLIEDGKAKATVQALTDAGFAVVAADLLGTGENSFPNPRTVNKGFAGYTLGYNRSLLANRVHDAITLIDFIRGKGVKQIHLLGFGEMGPVAILAKALAGDAVAKTAADLNRFRFESIKDTADPMLLPGAVKYGGMPAFLALCAPGEVLVHNAQGTGTGRLPKAAYTAAGAAGKLTHVGDKLDDTRVVAWLVK